jgi:hypothetical protein
MKTTVAIGLLLVGLGIGACGGASKPPLQPDNDNASAMGDGGPDPAPSGQPAPPAAK